MQCRMSIMMLIGCWHFTGTHTQNGVATVGNNETTPLRSDSLLDEFTKASESPLSETSLRGAVSLLPRGCVCLPDLPDAVERQGDPGVG